MPSEIEFSILTNYGQETSRLAALLRRHNPDARLMTIPWVDEYLELTNYATHKIGPDVSMVGNQTVSDLVMMDALRPFRPEEVAFLGGAAPFVPDIWKSIEVSADQEPYEIPWVSDPRLVYYWRDMLEDAGIDESQAFGSASQVEDTLRRLKESGVQTPLVLAAKTPSLTVQAAASWIWSAGGDFLSPDGREPLLDHPGTRAGLLSFFRLFPYMPPHSHEMHGEEASAYFRARRAAVTVMDICHGQTITEKLPEGMQSTLGVALPPGPPYRGGSSLVLWKRSFREERALDLIRSLVSAEVQAEFCLLTGYLPTRLDTLAMPAFNTLPYGDIYRQALEAGRFFPRVQGRGLIQNSISVALAAVWQDIFTGPGEASDIEAILDRRLPPVTQRIRWLLQ